MVPDWNDRDEWLETDGLGGFASGTIGGIRTRRYHGLYQPAVRPPVDRIMLVNGAEVFATTPAGTFPLSSQRYHAQTIYPEGWRSIESFTTDPWPTWRFKLSDGTVIRHELFLPHEVPISVASWRLESGSSAQLMVRPLVSGRSYHALHRENGSFRFDATVTGDCVRWHPYPDLPPISVHTNGSYQHAPDWYRHFYYQEEALRGFEATEDLASPGTFTFDLGRDDAIVIFGSEDVNSRETASERYATLRQVELRRRRRMPSRLHRSADQYLVRRGTGRTIIAGYPWFGDWGRDTFIALRGLCLATDRLNEARDILIAWAPYVSGGMLPNRFPDGDEAPEYNSADASLWYVIAVHELLEADDRRTCLTASQRETLYGAVDAILHGYVDGTRFGIGLDADGLLSAGQPGVQLTWMDAKIGDWVVTPRIGKPVELQALWLNAVRLAAERDDTWNQFWDKGLSSFRRRFWNTSGGYLYDVVDCDHVRGTADDSFRPNQIFAIGGLPHALIDGDAARKVVAQVERRLWTPLGLRSLAPEHPAYAGRYIGGPRERDAVYHQGTVWPWLIGPFVEAWVRVHGSAHETLRTARARFVEPLLRHLDAAGLGHVSEIVDGDAPHMPRGCPFQAWSLGELLRLDQIVLRERESAPASQPEQPALHPMCG